jgi:hypothetical protein
MLREGHIFFDTLVAYFWYLVVAGMSVAASGLLASGRFPPRGFWRWLLALSLPSAAVFGYVLWYEVARRSHTTTAAVGQLILGLAAFLCIAALAALQLSVWRRIERDGGRPGGRRPRTASSGDGPPPGKPLY